MLRYADRPIRELKMSARIERMREALLNMDYTTSDEHARLTAQAYGAHAEESVILRRAHAFAYVLDNMTLYIGPDELIVGNKTERPGAMHIVPDGLHPIGREVLRHSALLNRKDDQPMSETYDTRILVKAYDELLSPEARAAEWEGLCGMAPGSQGGFGHIVADYEKMIRLGALEIARQARLQLEVFAHRGLARQRDFAAAAAISMEAFARWGVRYAELAEAQAVVCTDPERAEALNEIARVCRRVPAHSATNFREALQCLILTHIAFFIEQYNGSISLSGSDQYLGPMLERDLGRSMIGWDEASELMDNAFIKIMECAMHPKNNQLFQHLSLGGQDVHGNDTANLCSLLMLDSTARMGFSQPSVSVRWHERINPVFWRRACECTLLGFGMPSMHSDQAVLNILDNWGVPRSEAVRYGIVGCNEPALAGTLHGQTLGAHINLAKCLELALNDGRSLYSGAQIAPHTGTLAEFENMEQVWAAYRAQVAHAVRLVAETVHTAGAVQRAHYGYPFMSALMEGAVEQGRDLTWGVKYNYPTCCVLGAANVADSMMVLEDLVFGGSVMDRGALQCAWQQGFEGGDRPLLEAFKNHPSKFGRGDKRASGTYSRVCSVHESEMEKYTGPRGGHLCSGVWPTTWHVVWGAKTGAGFDGRERGAYLADGAGPYQGGRKCDPTDVLRNMAEVDAAQYWPGGYTFNMWFSASALEGGEAMDKYQSLLQTYFELGGEQIQINTINKNILEAARKNPEAYQNLVVRVTGFSAYFVSLTPEVQQELIDRAQYTP